MTAKDFQEATANRILTVFKEHGQNRILLADEVGLGKTIVAREVIKKVSKWHKEDKHDDHFKVVYICSNINIASQNARKLGIDDLLKVSDSRLSMQHLKIYQNSGTGHDYEQLIPLTPATSFSMKLGCGTQSERALMFAHLKRMDCFKDIEMLLSKFMAYDAEKYWVGYYVNYYEKEVVKCDSNGSNYLKEMNEILTEKILPDLIEQIRANCQSDSATKKRESRPLINILRKIFARISLDKLEPDLVIMDEFQRFRDLITPTDNEQEMVSKQFLYNTDTKVLLLSATPYKLYSTLEEISHDESSEHVNEFMGVMNFLFYEADKNLEFKTVWSKYSDCLSEISSKDLTVLIARKDDAENVMYDGVCRTERFNSGVIDAQEAKEIQISDRDILSYSEAQGLLDTINKKSKKPLRYRNIPMDYVKSSPYLLSFMESYQIKKEIEAYFNRTHDYETMKKFKHQTLILKKSTLHNYKEIPANNARLEKLKEVVFGDEKRGVEKLLWIPPSKPYYKTGSVFDRNAYFSKVLVFSAWEIVPRMISVMMSYEAELRTIGQLYKNETSKRDRGYFTSKEDRRYGISRLKNETEEIICYPSNYLANLYDPTEYIGQDLKKIIKDLKSKITNKLDEYSIKYDLSKSGVGGAKALLELLKAIDGDETATLKVMPNNAAEIYAYMAIGSPGICGYRLFKNESYAQEIAKEFVGLFNKAESSAILDIMYGKNEDIYYKNVFKYCAAGNIQAMLDEYAHILNERGESLKNAMLGGFTDTTSIQIDTLESFTGEQPKPRIRTHFSVGYFNSRVSDENVKSTENIRTAFNSPFRPFVLATTSIGQEGLDFHFYCRKVMHWNLPSNPIDLEQREGRVNRYKCLAVRQNIAKLYGDENTWDDMFKKASDTEKGEYSDLVPFWCLTNIEEPAVKIERIVPMYPLSQDRLKYTRLIKILSLYRLTLGQPRQEELIELLNKEMIEKIDDKLFIDLSPFNKSRILKEILMKESAFSYEAKSGIL
jgi:hypothetical protein